MAPIFVAVLGATSFTFAKATWTQALPDWIAARRRRRLSCRPRARPRALPEALARRMDRSPRQSRPGRAAGVGNSWLPAPSASEPAATIARFSIIACRSSAATWRSPAAVTADVRASSEPSAAPISSSSTTSASSPSTPAPRHDFLETLEERHGRRSMIVTPQLPLSAWHEVIGDPIYADAILDRIVHNAHRIELIHESPRRTRGNPPKTLDGKPPRRKKLIRPTPRRSVAWRRTGAARPSDFARSDLKATLTDEKISDSPGRASFCLGQM